MRQKNLLKGCTFALVFCPLPLIAQELGPEFQVTSSPADDRNPMAFSHQNETWLFWDRETGADRQIFYRRLTADGQMLGEEMQLTYGPSSNQHPAIIAALGGNDAPLVVSWERGQDGNSDVVFAFHSQEQWSEIYEVFASNENENAPWVLLHRNWEWPQYIYYILITAKSDSAIIYKRYSLIEGELSLLEAGEMRRPNSVSSPSAAFAEYEDPFSGEHHIYMCFCWHETTSDDTLVFWRQFDSDYGWTDFVALDLGDLQAFNPSFAHFFPQSVNLFFCHVQNDTAKVGYANISFEGSIYEIEDDIFMDLNCNKTDPFIVIPETKVFVSDLWGNNDIAIYFSVDPEDQRVSLSSEDDLNPCSFPFPTMSEWYTPIFWESNRTGNWDIFGRVGIDYYFGIENPTDPHELPHALAISIHPNPANAEFRINLELPMAGHVAAAIFDLSGRRVAMIHEGWMTMGSHNMACNTQGFPSGIYLLRVESADNIQTRKVVLLK